MIYLCDDVQGQEDANVELCQATAARWGVSPKRASECDDGDVGCLDCPFQKETRHQS